MRDEQLVWVKEGAFWQIELATDDDDDDEAIYWIDDRKVWRWKFGGEEFESLYELGDTRFDAISAVAPRIVASLPG